MRHLNDCEWAKAQKSATQKTLEFRVNHGNSRPPLRCSADKHPFRNIQIRMSKHSGAIISIKAIVCSDAPVPFHHRKALPQKRKTLSTENITSREPIKVASTAIHDSVSKHITNTKMMWCLVEGGKYLNINRSQCLAYFIRFNLCAFIIISRHGLMIFDLSVWGPGSICSSANRILANLFGTMLEYLFACVCAFAGDSVSIERGQSECLRCGNFTVDHSSIRSLYQLQHRSVRQRSFPRIANRRAIN